MIHIKVLRAKNADALAKKINDDKEERFASQISIEPGSGEMVAFIFQNIEEGSSDLPATQKQKNFMEWKKIIYPDDCTKKKATELIDRFKNG